MPAPRHAQISWSGTFGGFATPVEIWVFGLSLEVGTATAGGPLQPSGNAQLVEAAGAFRQAWIDTISTKIGSLATLRRVRVAIVGDGGLVERNPNGSYFQGDDERAADARALGNAAPGIYQVSHAISTVTDTPGAVGRGRFFLPSPAFGPTPTGQLELGDAQGVTTTAAAFVAQINRDAGAYGLGRVCVASGGSVVKNIPPATYVVTGIRVGRRLDIIRSRANAIPEAYLEAPIVA
jgi:hypothetical protein